MAKILIGYGTTEGQTARIAEYIADVIRVRVTKRRCSTSSDRRMFL
jgi:menaquinone-dependent protoporphyrinogen IX oxidase